MGIFSAKVKPYIRVLRKHTRQFRFLYHLVLLRLRLWLVPIWSLPTALYLEHPQDPWQSEIDKARALMNGEFCSDIGGEPFDDFWKCVKTLPTNAQRRLYEFQWLRHLSIYPDKNKSAEFARRLVDEWREKQDTHQPISKQLITRAERLAYCFCYHEFLVRGASQEWARAQQRYYYEEVLVLADVFRRRGKRVAVSVLKALLYAAMIMPTMGFLLRPVNRAIKKSVTVRFYEDGGHRTRSPDLQRWDVATLLEIRASMKKRQMPISPQFDEALQCSLDALASFMHGDNKQACFHGSIEQPVDRFINLWQVWRKPKPLPQKILPNTGYVHLKSGDTTLIIDVGYKPMQSVHHYVGGLAFEFSRMGARLVVNCGAYRGEEEMWKEVSYRTAAHSTLSLDQFDAWGTGKLEDSFKMGHCSVEESEKDVTVLADHYGYADRFGYVHERQLTLAENGKTISGVDQLRSVEKRLAFSRDVAEKLYIRFHLHPSVTVEKMAPQSITLKLKNDELWDFSVEGEEIVPLVEESVYLGEDGLPKPTMQLVIPASLADEEEEKSFSWKFEWNKGP